MSEETLKPLVIGNWKTYVSREASAGVLTELAEVPHPKDVETVVCPSHTLLAETAAPLLANGYVLGGQSCSVDPDLPDAVDVPASALVDAGCKYVVVGHAERRRMFAEADHQIAHKVQQAIQAGLTPVLCLGEDADQRRSNQTTKALQQQLQQAIALFGANWSRMIVVYQPQWALDDTTVISVIQLAGTIRTLRQLLLELHEDNGVGFPQRILYGGSVDEHNAAGLMIGAEIDGVLVGRASYPAERFLQICLEVSLAARIGAYAGPRSPLTNGAAA
ncbi:triose-phosphate isomerase [Silvimonas iriomotensis]|uniref:Triosephosphate isomerase n=1 Tax=Silvimonas iriomotensis TaxID=449662 RepID=A0ABQ2P7I8_9NEIS|nr:triose-phosphate isomerase family protein [Silvimonas iriomotensis]GGP19848.1 triosephosphate isomerase [Silvimonas iriomotensis]